ncbi:MAG: glucosamine-6-phosphate deaminase [Clostridia bacterium]|nr:glucosamine-6-phosphate deaminase [Clostridia bacterium]
MKVIIRDTYEEMSRWAAEYIIDRINAHNASPAGEIRPFVLGLPTGSSPLGVYRILVAANREGRVSFKNVVTFNMDEYIGLPREHEQSYWKFMHDNLFDHIDIDPDNVNILNGMAADPEAECARYEDKIAAYGGIDLFLGGSGVDGHIAFNEPFTSLNSRTGVRKLTYDTLLANARFFGGDPEKVPKAALSVGVGTVMDASEVLLLLSGHNKARALRHLVEEPVSGKWTVSALQLHPAAMIACDEAACDELTVGTYKYFKETE